MLIAATAWPDRIPGVSHMCRYASIVIPLLLLFLPAGSVEAHAQGEPKRPFQVGERLTYEVSWLNMTAAIAVMEVAQMEGLNDRLVAKLVGTAHSTPIITN